MKEGPILFSGQMVQAILRAQNPKTQTRRIPGKTNSAWGAGDWKHFGHAFDKAWPDHGFKNDAGVYDYGYLHVPFWHKADGREKWAGAADRLYCRYEVGDRLWVKETFALCESRRAPDDKPAPIYRATSATTGVTWKPSIFMPRWASRITLEVVSVRPERLHDITEEDAKAEGINTSVTNPSPRGIPGFYAKRYVYARECFQDLWEFINGPGSWARNDWVWRIEFKRVK